MFSRRRSHVHRREQTLTTTLQGSVGRWLSHWLAAALLAALAVGAMAVPHSP
jgi:hypothetical protein